jgi:hypothetical protein
MLKKKREDRKKGKEKRGWGELVTIGRWRKLWKNELCRKVS